MGNEVSGVSTSFFVVSILGFLISVFWVRKFSLSYMAAFALIFIIMFIASFRAMHYASPDEQLQAIPVANMQKNIKKTVKKKVK